MTTFSTTASHSQPTNSVVEAVRSVLVNNEFRIQELTNHHLVALGPGLNSTKQNPLLGATLIELDVSDHEVELYAELGGVDRMRSFLMQFPWILGAGLGLLFAALGRALQGFALPFGLGPALGRPDLDWLLNGLAVGLLPVAPWLIVSPLMSHWIQQRTEHALDTLIANSVLPTVPQSLTST